MSVIAGAFMVLVFNQYWVRPRIEILEARLEELIGESGVPSPEVVAQREVAAREAAEAEPSAEARSEVSQQASESPTGSEERETIASTSPEEAVRGWARAWSEQRVDDYLSYYSPDFVPASGASRLAWEERRRQRLLGQGAIRVAVVSLQVEDVAPDEARVTFTQSYRSNTYQDRVRKTLLMSRIGGRWLIDEEVVIRQLPW